MISQDTRIILALFSPMCIILVLQGTHVLVSSTTHVILGWSLAGSLPLMGRLRLILMALLGEILVSQAVGVCLGFCDAYKAKLWGIFLSLDIAWRNGYRNIIMESDSQSIIDKLNGVIWIRISPLWGVTRAYVLEIGIFVFSMCHTRTICELIGWLSLVYRLILLFLSCGITPLVN